MDEIPTKSENSVYESIPSMFKLSLLFIISEFILACNLNF